MGDENPEMRIPEDEEAVVEMMEESDGEEPTEKEKRRNLAVAQARLIGDID